MESSFENFLRNKKGLTENGINSRISRLNWVEKTCNMTANKIVASVNNMHECRGLIYNTESNGHKAGNYYNALMLYYEYINEMPCPRISSRR